MFIRARMGAYLDSTAGKLDTISAEPIRTWHVTGTDAAIEAFRVAVGGVVVSDEDVVAVKTEGEVAAQVARVAQVTEKVAVRQAALDAATAELTVLTAVPVVIEPVIAK